MNTLRFLEFLFLAFLWQVVTPIFGLASGGRLASKGAASTGSHQGKNSVAATGGHPFTGGAYSYGEACILGGKNYFLSGASGPKPFAGRSGWAEKAAQQDPTTSSDNVSNANSDPSTSLDK